MLFHFYNPDFEYSHPYSLHQKSVSSLRLIFTWITRPYLLIKSSLQSPLTLPSSIPQKVFTSLFSCTEFPTIYIKNIFPTSNIYTIHSASMDQWAWEFCEDGHYFKTLKYTIYDTIKKLFYYLCQSIDRSKRVHNHWFLITQTQKTIADSSF